MKKWSAINKDMSILSESILTGFNVYRVNPEIRHLTFSMRSGLLSLAPESENVVMLNPRGSGNGSL